MRTCFEPGQLWLDTRSRPIQAHGGGMLSVNGVYYWYGEDKDKPNLPQNGRSGWFNVELIGIHCYSSRDLLNWRDEGLVLSAAPDDPAHDLHPRNVLERPKVVYNRATGKYVLWAHVDHENYQYARVGVAVADSPTGPFQYLGSMRPQGLESRDMTVFQDDDGAAYLVFGTNAHTEVCISRLTEDYLRPSGRYSLHFPTAGPPAGREAPAMFKYQGRYYIVTSGTTAWHPNAAQYAVAESIHGPWRVMGNPCAGDGAEMTFGAQSTYIFEVRERPACFIFMADLWNPPSLRDSRYVWLPMKVTGERLEIRWRDRWTLEEFPGTR